MTIDKELQSIIDDVKVQFLAEEAIKSWAKEENEKNKELLKAATLKFINHKFCFKSSLVNYPYIETTFQLIVEAENMGNYRLITLLDGTIENDYYEIY